MKSEVKYISDVSNMLCISTREIYDRLRMIGGYSHELAKGSEKATLCQEDVEYIINFKVFEKIHNKGYNALAEKIRRHPYKYRLFTHSLFCKA
ncbi:hypothetical protein [Francisella sp. SYW-9]|uniref:hypothetical protein n=1 Tax=Francisella sp. SYW-9 TaxID=2610888 RepID=UPI00123D6D48|nr:hypothetical protein [Francisella sp. SYW-9]